MFKLFLLIALVTSTTVYATALPTHSCIIKKSLAIFNPEIKEVFIRNAQTNSFHVSLLEHSPEIHLDLFDDDGKHWGKVSAMTGTLDTPNGRVIQANATASDWAGNTTAYLALVMSVDSAFGYAVTFDNSSNSDTPPNLTLECKL